MADNDKEKLIQTFYSILTVHEKQNILPDGEGEPYELILQGLYMFFRLISFINFLESMFYKPMVLFCFRAKDIMS